TIDFSHKEKEHVFLEGTGSMVLDRAYKIAYACLSPRTSKNLFEEWCLQMQYTPCMFTATDTQQQLIYHTNVMMCIADAYAVICLES
ncbi:arginine deiminase-related protein, partial [Acinetobacter baumannii]